jgi:Domain of unknown function (DUF4383)
MQIVTHVLMEVQMVKRVAMIFGVVFIILGLAGFLVPGGMQMGDAANAPKLLGLFPINLLHNLVHALIGLWGVVAARTFSASQAYCKLAGMIYLALAALAFADPTLFGLVPIGGNDIFLHTVFGVLLVWVGFASKEESPAADSAA